MSYNYFSQLDKSAQARYIAKLNLLGLEHCPYQLPGDLFIANPPAWPQVEFGDIFAYLIDTPGKFE